MRIKKLDEFQLNEEVTLKKNKTASYLRGKGKSGRAKGFYDAGRLAEQTPENFRKAYDGLASALRDIRSAYDTIQKMPVVDWTEEIPDLLKDLEQMLFLEDMSGDRWKNYLDRLKNKSR